MSKPHGATYTEYDIFSWGYQAATSAAMQWMPIESAPLAVDILLYCPDRGMTNPERIELGIAGNGRGNGMGSYHAWATHWMPVPSKPKALQPAAGE